MHLRRIAVMVTVTLAAVIIVVIAGLTFLGLSGEQGPTEDDPAAYTKVFVQKAIERYERDSREATIDYYNDPGNRDGQWYAFIIGEDSYTISHFNPEIRKRAPELRVNPAGYFFGDDLLSATEDGHWVEYVSVTSLTGDNRRKHTWVVRHDGLNFASGWYEE